MIELKAENEFRLTAEELEAAITPKTKLLVLPFPNNPTGAIMEKSDLEKIAEVIKKHDIFVLSDEIYSELTYLEKHVTIASLPGMWERTIVINGFSKSHAMTGWRLGYACGPRVIIEQMLKIHQFAIMCAPSTSQYAGVEALKNGDEDVAQMREEYNGRRRYLLHRFKEMGLSCFRAVWSILCVPMHQRIRYDIRAVRHGAFKYREACSRSGNGIRRLRGRIYPYFLCVFAGEFKRGDEPHGGIYYRLRKQGEKQA